MPTNEKDNDFFIANRRFLSKEQIALIEAFHYQLKNSPQFRQGLLLSFYCLKITNRYWLLSDGELMKKVFTVPENKIEQTIIDFYSQGNYLKIRQMVLEWGKYIFISSRMSVFNSCLNVLLSDLSNEDKYNVLIPTLTAQLSGLKDALYPYIGKIPKKRKENIENELRKKLKKPKDKVSENTILLKFLAEERILPGLNLLELNQIIFNTTFARGGKINELNKEKYNKFRNKILHGDSDFLNYGTEVNMIRAWLEVNFLIMVHNEIQKYLESTKT